MHSASTPAPQPAPSDAGSPRIVRFCDAVITWTLLVLAAVVPLFFLPWTIEVSELNKQLLVFVGAGVAGLAWLGKMLAERKFEYRRSVVNVIVLLYLAVYALSSWTSYSPYMSLVGDFGQELYGFFTVLSFVTLYFVTINHIKSVEGLKRLLKAVMFGGFFVALYALLQGLGVFVLPFAFAQSPSFNTIGTVAALGVYLAFLVTLASGLILADHGADTKRTKKDVIARALVVVTAVLSLLLIAAIDFWPVSLSLLIASAVLIAFAFMHAGRLKGLSGVLLPIAALIVAALLIFFRFPVALQYPAEVMPSMKASADIAMKTMREAPLLGTGPGTFIFDYAKHRAPEVNTTAFWNIRFDRGASSFLTLVATLGLLGTLSWLMVSLFLLASAGRKLLKADEQTWHILIGMFAAWLLLVVSKFLYSSTMALEFMFWLTMAMLVIVHRKDFYTVRFERSPRAAMTLSFVFILSVVFVVSGYFIEGQRYAAETAYADAIRTDRAGGEIDDVINGLTAASNLNQSNDVYLRNLGLAVLVKADQLFSTQVDSERTEDESDEEYRARVQSAAREQLRQASVMTANAVNIAKRATEINDKNVANWSVLASIYQSLMGITEGADQWAKASYQRAIELEPSNPSLRTELGKVLVYQADRAAEAARAEGEEGTDEEAAAGAEELLGQAVDAFNKAIELKSDYAPAHYNLALALDRQGKLKEAITRMEGVVQLNPQDAGVGFQLSLLYFRNDQKEDAVRLMESVVRLQPNFSNARWYLAAMHEDAGNLDAAIAQIEEVQELNPGNELVERKLGELRAKKETPPPAEGEELPPPVEEPVENPNEPGVQR